MTKRNWAAGISVVALFGAALWMRELVSWRPVTVARLGTTSADIELSRDGRQLLIQGVQLKPRLAVIKVVLGFDAAGGNVTLSSNPGQVRRFWKQGAPRPWLSLNKSQTQFIFSPSPGKKVLLEGVIVPQYFDFDACGEGASSFRWFKARGEIYREGYNELRIWDAKTGRLKSHNHWNSDALSPDGLSSLGFTLSPQGVFALIRYHVPSGQFASVIYRTKPGAGFSRGGDCGWSPDGKAIWFTRQNSAQQNLDFNVVRAADSKFLWSAPCAGTSKWLPDGRIGLIQRGGFSWRDASGRETLHLLGPLPGGKRWDATDWEATPDGKWILSCEKGGIIRRWRAR